MFKNKIRHNLNVTNEDSLLNFMREKLPAKGLAVIFCPNIALYKIFQCLFIKYFARNKNLKVLKANLFIEDITDREILLQQIEKTHIKNNHRGINEVYEELRSSYVYPKLRKEIQKFINSCDICKLAKYDRSPVKHSLNITPTPEKHNDIVHLDIWYPLRGAMYLTSIDKLTKYATAFYLEERTWVSILKAIKERIQYLGRPRLLIFDNDLDTAVIREFLKEQGINFHTTTTYLKTGNADVERLQGTLNERIRLYNADLDNKDDINEKVHKSIIAYNNSIHTTTNNRSIDLLNNMIPREEVTKLSQIMHEKKTKRIDMLNQKNNRVETNSFANDIVNNNRVSQNQNIRRLQIIASWELLSI